MHAWQHVNQVREDLGEMRRPRSTQEDIGSVSFLAAPTDPAVAPAGSSSQRVSSLQRGSTPKFIPTNALVRFPTCCATIQRIRRARPRAMLPHIHGVWHMNRKAGCPLDRAPGARGGGAGSDVVEVRSALPPAAVHALSLAPSCAVHNENVL